MGSQIISAIRNNVEKQQDVPILVLSGMSKRENMKKTVEAGADDYIVKPFSIENLNKKIIKLILGMKES